MLRSMPSIYVIRKYVLTFLSVAAVVREYNYIDSVVNVCHFVSTGHCDDSSVQSAI